MKNKCIDQLSGQAAILAAICEVQLNIFICHIGAPDIRQVTLKKKPLEHLLNKYVPDDNQKIENEMYQWVHLNYVLVHLNQNVRRTSATNVKG